MDPQEDSSVMANVSTGNWRLKPVVNEDNMTYIAWNEATREGIIVDPMNEDCDIICDVVDGLGKIRWIAIVDTHTHADHISCAAHLANKYELPLLMSELAPSKRVSLRVSLDTNLQTGAGALKILMTPGHTIDGITLIWGPYLFTGDTILYGDTGRDDLPGGNPTEHYESLVKIKKHATPDLIFLPGHDARGGRDSTWGEQLKMNTSLTQPRDEFIQDAAAFKAAPPKNLKESLFENMK